LESREETLVRICAELYSREAVIYNRLLNKTRLAVDRDKPGQAIGSQSMNIVFKPFLWLDLIGLQSSEEHFYESV